MKDRYERYYQLEYLSGSIPRTFIDFINRFRMESLLIILYKILDLKELLKVTLLKNNLPMNFLDQFPFSDIPTILSWTIETGKEYNLDVSDIEKLKNSLKQYGLSGILSDAWSITKDVADKAYKGSKWVYEKTKGGGGGGGKSAQEIYDYTMRQQQKLMEDAKKSQKQKEASNFSAQNVSTQNVESTDIKEYLPYIIFGAVSLIGGYVLLKNKKR